MSKSQFKRELQHDQVCSDKSDLLNLIECLTWLTVHKKWLRTIIPSQTLRCIESLSIAGFSVCNRQEKGWQQQSASWSLGLGRFLYWAPEANRRRSELYLHDPWGARQNLRETQWNPTWRDSELEWNDRGVNGQCEFELLCLRCAEFQCEPFFPTDGRLSCGFSHHHLRTGESDWLHDAFHEPGTQHPLSTAEKEEATPLFFPSAAVASGKTWWDLYEGIQKMTSWKLKCRSAGVDFSHIDGEITKAIIF